MTPTLKRGASFACAVIVREGDALGGTIQAVVKRRAEVERKGDAAPDLAVFTPTWADHWDGDASSPPGWILSLTPEQTAALPADDCVMDARVSKGGVVVVTETEALKVIQRVTEPNDG
ncbi:hypothetical protein [Brevundimonas vesicularis]|uniref:Uncharacterized protein n=1 Tax=Brevundimonas vesicularis TaxID=41276 RepID=A0A1Z3U7A4_BREVE|nr:hypothetical protein [Brevundimonas vesicularis]ASE39149.1 hypothetical protein CEP68_06330 [Brevundimonas vesicularis]